MDPVVLLPAVRQMPTLDLECRAQAERGEDPVQRRDVEGGRIRPLDPPDLRLRCPGALRQLPL